MPTTADIPPGGLDFQALFTAGLPDVPAELLDEDPDLADLFVFEVYPPQLLPAWLGARARQLLQQHGLPRNAAPGLSFFAPAQALAVSAQLPAPGLAIGRDGAGNLLAVEAATGEVVMLDHDNDDARVYVNRDLVQFAHCLCAFTSHGTHSPAFLQAVADLDPPAVADGAFWSSEC